MSTSRQPQKKLRRQKNPTDNLAALRRTVSTKGQQDTDMSRSADHPERSQAVHEHSEPHDGTQAHRQRLLKALQATTAKKSVAKSTVRYRPGDWFQVVAGEFAGCRGSVIELNFIDNQALLQITIVEEPVWVAFEHLVPDSTEDN